MGVWSSGAKESVFEQHRSLGAPFPQYQFSYNSDCPGKW